VPVIIEYGKRTGELHSHGKTEELGEKATPVPLCPSQIPCVLLWDRTGSLTLFFDNKNTTTTTNNNNNNDNNNNNNKITWYYYKCLIPVTIFNIRYFEPVLYTHPDRPTNRQTDRHLFLAFPLPV